MTFLNGLLSKNRNAALRTYDETGKVSIYGVEDGHSETDYHTCSSRTDDSDLIVFQGNYLPSELEFEGQRKSNRLLPGRANMSDPSLSSLDYSLRKILCTAALKVTKIDISECDSSITDLKVVEEASPSDRLTYGYGDIDTERVVGTGTHARSSSMPMNKLMIQDNSSKINDLQIKPGRSNSLSHKEKQSKAGRDGAFFGVPSVCVQNALSLTRHTRQPPISSFFSASSSRKPPKQTMYQQDVRKPFQKKLLENNTKTMMSPVVLSDQTMASTMEQELRTSTIQEKVGYIRLMVKKSSASSHHDSLNSFGCMSLDESDDSDDDDDLLIETALHAIFPTERSEFGVKTRSIDLLTSEDPPEIPSTPCEDRSLRDLSHYSLCSGNANNLDLRASKFGKEICLDRDDKNMTPEVYESLIGHEERLCSEIGDLDKQQEVIEVTRLRNDDIGKDLSREDTSPRRVTRVGSDMRLVIPTKLHKSNALIDADAHKEYSEGATTIQSPRCVARGDYRYFFTQEHSTRTTASKDEKPSSVGLGPDFLSRSDHTHRKTSKWDSLSRSDHSFLREGPRSLKTENDRLKRSIHAHSTQRPCLLKSKSARLMYTKHEDLLAEYEKIVQATDTGAVNSKTCASTDLVPGEVASPTSCSKFRRLGLMKAESAGNFVSEERNGSLERVESARRFERGATKRENFTSPRRSRSLIFDMLHSSFRKNSSDPSENPDYRGEIHSFRSPKRTSSLMHPWKRSSPLRKKSGIVFTTPLPILQNLSESTKSTKANSRIISSSTCDNSRSENLAPTRGTRVTGGSSAIDCCPSSEHKYLDKNDDHICFSPTSTARVPQRTKSLFSPRESPKTNYRTSPCQRKAHKQNLSFHKSLPMIEPLPGITQSGICARSELRRATSLRAMRSDSERDGLKELFDEYAAIVDNASEFYVTGWK